MDSLKPFFEPKSIVVIGVSNNEQKLGYGVAKNLVKSGYNGKINFVNPKGGELFGRKVFASVEQLDESIDLAVIAISAKNVPPMLLACSQKGIKNFIIISSGFREIGQDGAKIEEICKEIQEKEDLRILGPNCIGIIDTNFPIDTTFLPNPHAKRGEIAFVTQSGALGAAIIDWAAGENVGISRLVSLGNQMDVDESDVLLATAESKYTKSIMVYLESVKNGPKFLRFAELAAKLKPVVVLKSGNSQIGEKAAFSHTGALAGADVAFDAAFRRSGILRANTTKNLFDWAKLLSSTPLPENNRIAILTNAGGPGVIAADDIESNGLRLANLAPETLEKLDVILPEAASKLNPVDMLASASPESYAHCLKILLADPEVDMCLVIVPPPPMYSALDIARELTEVIQASKKPVVVSLMGNQLIAEAVEVLRQKKISVFSFPEEGIAGLGALWKYKTLKNQDQQVLKFSPNYDKFNPQEAIRSNGHLEPYLTQELTEKFLREYKIPYLGLQFACDEYSAANKAALVGYPVVMKVSVDGISHKTDIAGVELNLKSESEVRKAFRRMEAKVALASQNGSFRGVFIQKMLEIGQEVVIGAIRDPIFGPVVMFGSGGVDVEILGDIKFALAPITKADIDYLLSTTIAGKKLKGFRQFGEMDVTAVKECIVKISQLLVDTPEIFEVEINPLIVGENGNGAYAVDARISVKNGKNI